MVDYSTGRPAYQQVADALRGRILDGTLRPGDMLPSERAIMDEFDVSRTVPRMAIKVLSTEGLIDTHQGKGAFVRRPVQPRRLSADRYRRGHPGDSPFSRDVPALAEGRTPTWDHRVNRARASARVAERLGIEEGDVVVVARYVFMDANLPLQRSTSYEPAAIVAGTPIEDPESGPITGDVIARMDSIGRRVTSVVEDVSARAPSPSEINDLRIKPGIPVLLVARTMYADDTPVECCDILIPADRTLLSYRLPVD